ncbi:MAG: BMP family ABC transporter substrate-binding protein [Thermoleophilia bacterium]|nr:BMP family ABC transporter substrate-binding protein [Thermoleophilia bacterium]
MRRIVVLLVILSAAVFVGTATSAGAKAGGAPLQVRVITATATTAGTWDPSQFAAYSAVSKQMGWKLQIGEAVPYGEADQMLDRWGAGKADIVFSTDNGFETHMLAAAKKYPGTLWVTMSDLSTTNGLANVAAYSVNWCEVGFVEGVAGALVSKTHMISAVESIPILPTSKTLAGMKIGAEVAVPGTKVTGQIVGGFDGGPSAEVASNLISKGADVLFAVATGGASPAIAARAQQLGKLYVGSYGDESRFAPKATVTSAVLKFGLGYVAVAKQRQSGTFKPGIIRKGVADGYISLTAFRLGKTAQEAQAAAILKNLVAGKYAAQMAKCQAATK